MRFLDAVVAVLAFVPATRAKLTQPAQSLFDYSMEVQDQRWDDSYKLINYPDNGPWSVRFTAWYTAGLLHRNKGSDVANAKAAIDMILKCQMNEDYDSAWYGTFKLSPDQPYPTQDSPLYPPEIYGSYDPNWREFVGTQLVQVVEEFPDLLGNKLISRIEDALEAAAVGAMRRNGTFPLDDNLTIAYANPALMRAWFVGWIGYRRNNKTFIDFANEQGDLILKLFKSTGDNVFSEYNAPTYYGMDAWALAGNIKYGAKKATMTKNAEFMMTEMWKDVAAHWNPYLGNMVGPYDRAYTRDLTTHSAVISMFWWGLYGYEYGPHLYKGELDLLYDIAQGAALALIMDTTAEFISKDVAKALKAKGSWKGSRLITETIPDALGVDADKRIATSWISSPLMIGAEQVAEDVNRGNQFVPAIVHWAGDKSHKPFPYNTFFSLYPSASTVDAVAGKNSLTVSYPNSTQEGSGIFTYALSNVPPSWTLGGKHVIDGFESLPCLKVTVDAPGLEKQPVTYGQQLRDHLYYNISYVVPAGFEGTPKMEFKFRYTC
ncbi:hypothetical protein QQX98_004459 [Neonectria punicea]|uniref:Uncharacterized protein n=1 Tax=Neonectria punicea TaxID=979145 RepID=A0ABR1H949_9HYPO